VLDSDLKTAVAIDCRAVATAYQPTLRRPILNGISFAIQPGEFVALLGLNGAGKSSLLRAMVGLTAIQQGSLVVDGIPVTPRTLPQVWRRAGLLFQGGGLVPQLTAIENVLCGCLGHYSSWQTLWGFNKAERRRALDLLSQLGLRELAYQRTANLSGGQQQRVAIARALIQSPDILLVDEPITGLDVLATRQVMDTLADLNRQQGITVVAVLHDLAIATTYAQRAIVLEQGQVIHDGACHSLPTQLLQAEATYKVGA